MLSLPSVKMQLQQETLHLILQLHFVDNTVCYWVTVYFWSKDKGPILYLSYMYGLLPLLTFPDVGNMLVAA